MDMVIANFDIELPKTREEVYALEVAHNGSTEDNIKLGFRDGYFDVVRKNKVLTQIELAGLSDFAYACGYRTGSKLARRHKIEDNGIKPFVIAKMARENAPAVDPYGVFPIR